MPEENILRFSHHGVRITGIKRHDMSDAKEAYVGVNASANLATTSTAV